MPPNKLDLHARWINFHIYHFWLYQLVLKEVQELILLSWGSKSKDTLHESGERRAPRMCCKFAIYADCFLTLLSPDWESWLGFGVTVRITTAMRPSELGESRKRLQVRLTILCSLAKRVASHVSSPARTHVEEKAVLAKNWKRTYTRILRTIDQSNYKTQCCARVVVNAASEKGFMAPAATKPWDVDMNRTEAGYIQGNALVHKNSAH